MTSSASGKGQVFWQEQGVRPAFFRDRSQHFTVKHDGERHEYKIHFTAKKPVIGVRIDPATARGKIDIFGAKLTDDQGRVLHQWRF